LLELAVKGLGIFIVAFLGGSASAVTKHLLTWISKSAEQKVNSRNALEKLIVETLEEVRLLSISYWSVEESAEQRIASHRIVAICDSFPDLYRDLFDGCENFELVTKLDAEFNRLTDAITGGTFQEAGRRENEEVIPAIDMGCFKLTTLIKIQKAKLPYPLR